MRFFGQYHLINCLQQVHRPDILCQKVHITRHCIFPLNIALKKTFQL